MICISNVQIMLDLHIWREGSATETEYHRKTIPRNFDNHPGAGIAWNRARINLLPSFKRLQRAQAIIVSLVVFST